MAKSKSGNVRLLRWVIMAGLLALAALGSLTLIGVTALSSDDARTAEGGKRLVRATSPLYVPVALVWALALRWARSRVQLELASSSASLTTTKGPTASTTPPASASQTPARFVYPTHPVILPRVDEQPAPDAEAGPLVPIRLIRDLLGPAPRQFDPALSNYLQVNPPLWLKSRGSHEDEQWDALLMQDQLRKDGHVVWAAVVQANNKAFEQRVEEVGASVIWSVDPYFDSRSRELLQMARECFALKGHDQADAQAAAFSRMLTSELMRGQKLPVPSRFTGGRAVFHSSMLLTRKHLPEGFLAASLFPVFVDRELNGTILLVPAAYWPPSLLSTWKEANPRSTV